MKQFNETQKVASNLGWVERGIAILVLLLFLWGFVQQVIFEKPFGSKPAPDWIFPILILLIGGIWLLTEKMQLNTKIDQSGVHMHFFPLTRKNIPWSQIEKVQIVDYGFIGGWGIRASSGYGTVYNIQGSKGLWVKLNNGDKFVIGTQKIEDMQQVLNSCSG